MTTHAQSNIASFAGYTGVINEDDAQTNKGGLNKNIVPLTFTNERTYKLVWGRVIGLSFAYVLAIYGAYSMFASAKIPTTIYGEYYV